MKSSTHKEPKREDIALTDVLYALSDEIRLQIVRSLAREDEIACGYFPIQAPKSSLSHHFGVLRNSGIIATRREGTTLLNRLRRSDIDARFPGLLDPILYAQEPESLPAATRSSTAPSSSAPKQARGSHRI